jgi:hypothetical protein
MAKRTIIILLGLLLIVGLALTGMGVSKAQAAGKHFEGIRIVFFPGGSEGGPFA